LDKETAAAAVGSHALFDEDCDSDEDADQGNRHDFSIALDDVDELLLKLTQSQPKPAEPQQLEASDKLPQVDGADDGIQRTPKKLSSSKPKGSPPRTPTTPKGQKSLLKSPRTPKTSAAKKYAPLALTIGSSSAKSG